MAGTILGAKSVLNLRLGQIAQAKDPAVNAELQGVYNALHILNQYMELLAENIEGGDGDLPSESLRFRSSFWATALQSISPGDVICTYGNGMVKGVKSNTPASPIFDSNVTVGSPGSRTMFGLKHQHAYIALTAAAVNEPVRVGVGPGILAVTGTKCGNIVWARDHLSVYTTRRANTSNQNLVRRDLVADGGLLLNNATGGYGFVFEGTPGRINWEGYWLPGFPTLNGNMYQYNRVFLYPVGICVVDGFVLFNDYVRSDSLPLRVPPLP